MRLTAAGGNLVAVLPVRPSREFVARTAASARFDITARIEEAEVQEVLFEEGAQGRPGFWCRRLPSRRQSRVNFFS